MTPRCPIPTEPADRARDASPRPSAKGCNLRVTRAPAPSVLFAHWEGGSPSSGSPAMPHLTEILATPEAAARKRFRRLDFFTPHPKQLDFIAATKDHNEVMLRAGNQQGKSEAAYMTACHLTGDYPKTWAGHSASPRCGRFRRLIPFAGNGSRTGSGRSLERISFRVRTRGDRG